MAEAPFLCLACAPEQAEGPAYHWPECTGTLLAFVWSNSYLAFSYSLNLIVFLFSFSILLPTFSNLNVSLWCRNYGASLCPGQGPACVQVAGRCRCQFLIVWRLRHRCDLGEFSFGGPEHRFPGQGGAGQTRSQTDKQSKPNEANEARFAIRGGREWENTRHDVIAPELNCGQTKRCLESLLCSKQHDLPCLLAIEQLTAQMAKDAQEQVKALHSFFTFFYVFLQGCVHVWPASV